MSATPPPARRRERPEPPHRRGAPVPPVRPGRLEPPARPDALAWLGHATCVLDVGAVRLVTDPLLGAHAGILRRLGGIAPSAEDWSGADAVLVSHLHHDHAHVASLRSTHAVVLSAPANARWLGQRGLPTRGLGPEEWWRPSWAPQVAVRAVHAVHGHRPMPHRPNATVGFLVVRDAPGDDDAANGGSASGTNAPGAGSPSGASGASADGALRIWFAGDTELYPELAHLPDVAGGPIDLALVPIGGWGPRLSGGHMDPTQAAHACALVGARRAVPVHWGTLHAPLGRNLPRGWMEHGGAAFEAAVRRLAPDCEPVVLAPGERLAL
ncbi:MBL fold metallo-hydrolase [Miniimonas sp. S16]|uniref:MBL fold metallo-hydrolase n=1 Tax=Miniimonas sp. S16 TaxID=2171623 RepID=UPI001F2F417D|nr:MBL fold metallo-hydrolase [Miniimonas sp. S16]